MLSMVSALEKAKKTRCGVFLEVVTTSTSKNCKTTVFFSQVSISNARIFDSQIFLSEHLKRNKSILNIFRKSAIRRIELYWLTRKSLPRILSLIRKRFH